jgi:hypothetical protein
MKKKSLVGWTYKFLPICFSRPKVMVYLEKRDAKYVFGKDNIVKVHIIIEKLKGIK